ncbi:nuclear transport factor 2 family protein [Xanthomonas sp. SHU 199]|uniref:nuclear transport factor 2 family protein n=2 Tax=unclassified Xanthomonas TaxID=2643310 RepID=UPI000372F3C3|nr:nuclear transport factor 2 family protein [Xanthomonas sp. SHU 199]
MTEANQHVLQVANAAIAAGDYEGFLAHCTEDTTWHFIGERILRGKQAVREWMADAYRQPPQFDVRKYIIGDGHVVALGQITLETGDARTSLFSYCDVWRFRDGRMAELEAYVVPLAAAQDR